MPFDVEVHFHGLCLFHYNYPEKGKVTVLLVNANKQEELCARHDKLHQHLAYLRFEDRCDIPLGYGYEVDLGTKTGKVGMTYKKIPMNAVPKADLPWGKKTEMQWVAQLDEVLNHVGVQPKLHSDCYGPLPNARVVARLLLHEGDLECDGVAEDGPEPVKWAFRKHPTQGPDYWGQALTDHVVLKLKKRTESFPITLRQGAGKPETIHLEASGGKIALGVDNEPTPNAYTGSICTTSSGSTICSIRVRRSSRSRCRTATRKVSEG